MSIRDILHCHFNISRHNTMQFSRKCILPNTNQAFFLWGPRQVGKTCLLRTSFPDAFYIDLLDSKKFIKYCNNPDLLYQELKLLPDRTLVIIDEVQKVPLLLDEVHRLIEEKNLVFALCGSSARKLKRGQANLLGGRALRYELFGLSYSELGSSQDIVKLCNTGNIPNHYLAENFRDLLESYVSDYLKEEIYAEALVRNLPTFSDFLRVAAICDTEIVDYTNIASDCGVKGATAKNYYEILTDTLQGFYLPAYTRKPKRKIINSPKFYFANVGVVNFLAKRFNLLPGSDLFGKSFENVIINEIRAWNSYRKQYHELSYWKLASGAEVDVVIEDLNLAIEIKSSSRILPKHLKGLKELLIEQPKFTNRIVVSMEDVSRITPDNIIIYNYRDFVEKLWNGELNI